VGLERGKSVKQLKFTPTSLLHQKSNGPCLEKSNKQAAAELKTKFLTLGEQ